MRYSRREFGRLTLAGVPGVALATRSGGLLDALAQSKPNSLIDGVQIGTITYSYRSMPDQTAEATLKYIIDSGISAIELMGGPVESFAGAPQSAGRGGGGGRGPAGAAGGRGREAEGLAHERLHGRLQEAAQDVQRRRRDDLRVEAAQPEHVGR